MIGILPMTELMLSFSNLPNICSWKEIITAGKHIEHHRKVKKKKTLLGK